MIDVKAMLNDFAGDVAIWAGGADDAELAGMAQAAVNAGIDLISCPPGVESTLWPWLERMPIKIITRFYMGARVNSDTVSELTSKINASFKQGAAGAQIFVRFADLEKFAAAIYPVRDDLFFNHDLFVGIDIDDVGPYDWGHLFDLLNKIRASGLMLVLTKYSGDKSDFVGRVYGALNAWKFDGALHFVCGEYAVPVHQAARLISGVRPELAAKTRFFAWY